MARGHYRALKRYRAAKKENSNKDDKDTHRQVQCKPNRARNTKKPKQLEHRQPYSTT